MKDDGISAATVDVPDTSSVAISCLKSSEELVQAPLFVTTCLFPSKQSVAVPPLPVSPSKPTVPDTERVLHGEVVAIPSLPPLAEFKINEEPSIFKEVYALSTSL